MSEFVVNRPDAVNPVGRSVTLVLLLTLVMTATGACNTADLSLVHRYCLWLVVCALLVVQVVTLAHLAQRLWPERFQHLPIVEIVAIGVTVVLMTIELHFLKYTPLLPKALDPPLAFLLFVTPIVGPVALLVLLLVHQPRKHAAQPSCVEPASDDYAKRVAPGLLLRANRKTVLPDWPAKPVQRISAQDHYLLVQTPDGEQLIRGRIRDALVLVAHSDGVQVHRSHWVATDQIVRIFRRGRDYRVLLRGGASLPVSRARVAALRSALER